MHYIDNDMDELFNKAGRDYPLKTDNGNWDAVSGRLRQPEPPLAPLNPKTNQRYYWFLLLLLLPPAYLMYDNGDNNRVKMKPAEAQNHGSAATVEKKQTGSLSGNSGTVKNNNNGINRPAPQKNDGMYAAGITAVEKNKPSITFEKNAVNRDLRLPTAGRSASPRAVQGDESGLHEQGANHDLPAMKSNLRKIPVLYSYTVQPISIDPILIQTSQSPQPGKPKHLKTSSLYFGLVAGPDLSTVKYQEIRNTGYSAGLLAGYRFGKRWAVEAGILYSKKKYFTDGKYFDKAGTNIPPSVTIENMDGICEMFEIPLSVRYDFSVKENTIFATAGITSYLMNEEEYDYGAWSGGSWYRGHRSYDNSGNHFFSNMQLSVGYNYKVSGKLSLRMEPYIKIPLSHVGVGNLPITSTGVYFGIMRKIR